MKQKYFIYDKVLEQQRFYDLQNENQIVFVLISGQN